MSEREPSGIDLAVIDFGAYGDFMSWGGIVKNDRTYVICSEGVGYDITEWSAEKNQQSWGMGLAEIQEKIEKADEGYIDLAHLVRIFGARLEGNLYLWINKLSD